MSNLLKDSKNAALIADLSDAEFCAGALKDGAAEGDLIVSDDPEFLHALAGARKSYTALNIDLMAFEDQQELSHVSDQLMELESLRRVIFDLRWTLDTPYISPVLQNWGAFVDGLADEVGIEVVSVYDQEIMVEDALLGALTAHQAFLAPSGRHKNPYWVPRHIRAQDDPEMQARFLIGRLVPDYAQTPLVKSPSGSAGRATVPSWAARTRRGDVPSITRERWYIHCLGPLKVFVEHGQPVNWNAPGGSVQKTKALFAYLLTHGETGAGAEQLGEVLWPDGRDELEKRNRLHHTVSVLRRVLGDAKHVTRSGDRYYLHVPAGSWTDVEQFEQLCRRGLSLFQHDDLENALRVYEAAARTYGGDLFQDVSRKYVESEDEDWCLPKRAWLRGMAAKLHTDMSRLLRSEDRLREAIHHSARALEIEPADENANVEMIRVLQAQGRTDAVARHYKHFASVAKDLGVDLERTKVHKVASTVILV